MKNLKIIIIVVLYLPLFSEAIFGGENVADPHKYPWLTKLYIFNENGAGHECGGSILTENVIITAAHCVLNVSKITVLVGHPNITSEEIFATSVKSVIIHPDYNHDKNLMLHDIALLQLHTNLSFTKSIQPIALPRNDLPLYVKPVLDELIEEYEALINNKASKLTKFFVAGWGKSWNFNDESYSTFLSFYDSNFELQVSDQMYQTKNKDEEYSKWMAELTTNASSSIMLKEIQLQLSLDVCLGALQGMSEKEVNDLISYTICARGIFPLWQGVCNGDSGSPLMKVKEGRYQLVGIAFWKYTCTRYPAYYTRVSKYLTWIHRNLRKFDPQCTKYLKKSFKKTEEAFSHGGHLKKSWKPNFIFEIFSGMVTGLELLILWGFYEVYYSRQHHNGFKRLTIFIDFPMSRRTMITVFGLKIIRLPDWCILWCCCILPTLGSTILLSLSIIEPKIFS